MPRVKPLIVRASCFLVFCHSLLTVPGASLLELRFVDSATGFSVRPEVAMTRPDGYAESIVVSGSGWTPVDVEPGDYSLSINASNYVPVAAAIAVQDSGQRVQFTLDPIIPPVRIWPDNVRRLQRPDTTMFLGYVHGDDTGNALSGVEVVAEPSGVRTTTDPEGFFQLAVPLQTDVEWQSSPAKLVFRKAGYRAQERTNLELAPFGDFILRVELSAGSGSDVVDEQGRRIEPIAAAYGRVPGTAMAKNSPALVSINPTNATSRIPRNIRVQLSDGTIDYVSMETYVQRSLNDEWIASWGNLASGAGIQSLKAGAVAVRSYAAWHVNNPRGSTYDICATTSCQVYDADTSSNADTAASQTAGYVVITSSGLIARSEYSAENNSIGSTVTGVPCGDGYTEPDTSGPVCLFDPACSGEVRFGHGRGMCQWGTARWASGFKISNRSTADTSPNGYPQKDWIWMVNHYYPNLTLVQAKPLVIGDDIKIIGSTTRTNHLCSDGGIASGVNCPPAFTKPAGATGVITAGPQRVTSDGRGFTWWKVTWSDNAIGWIPENYLERVVPAPGDPIALSATAVNGTRVDLSWSDTNSFEAGFLIQRSPVSGQPWLEIAQVGVNMTSFSDTNVTAGNTYYYRVRAFNVTGNSGFSPIASASTPGIPPSLAAINNRTVTEGTTLVFTNVASAPDRVQRLANFENFEMETDSGTILFRKPRFSGSTSALLGAVPDYSSVTELFPAGAGLGKRALVVSCNFTNTTTPWLRLTTSGTSIIPNPVIDLTNKLQLSIYSDHNIAIALGLRETGNPYGTPVGANGGSTGAMEWAGVTNVIGGAPKPNRSVPAGAWTTLTFDLPNEPVRNFSGGNGVLSTATGLGVLEHLAIVPEAGTNIYRIFLDNFAVLQPRKLTFSLGSGAPAGASIGAQNGVFTWTPTELQGPSTNSIQVIVSDDGTPVLKTTNTFTVVVTESNSAPVLAAIADRLVHAGTSVVFTNSATDSDRPSNLLTFSLGPGAPATASINATTGVFSWTPSDAFANTTNAVSVIVTDNGSPVRSDSKTFAVAVLPRPRLQNVTLAEDKVTFTWSSIAGENYRIQYKNSLSEPTWANLADVVAVENTMSRTEPLASQRFYRIVVLD